MDYTNSGEGRNDEDANGEKEACEVSLHAHEVENRTGLG